MKATTRLTIQFYLKHLSPLKGLTAVILVALLLAIASNMTFPILYKGLINALTADGSKETIFPTLMHFLWLIIALDVFNSLAWRVVTYSSAYLESKAMASIFNDCFESLHRHSYNFFNNNFAGALVKKVGRIVRAFENIADKMLFEFFPSILRVLIAITVLFVVHPLFGFLLTVWTLIFIGFNYFLSLYRMEHYDLHTAQADTRVSATLADTITNNSNIKLFSALPYEFKRFKEDTDHWFRRTKAGWFFSSHIEVVQAILMIVLNGVMLYFAIQLWKTDQLTVGDFVLIQGYLFELFRQLWDFGRMLRMLYQGFADAEEMTLILNQPLEIQDQPNAKPLVIRHGKIEFEKVSFAYEGENGVIQNFSLKLNPSEKVALIGPSGGGKSTITKLILRLFDVDSGKILIDGQAISKVTQESLRRQIALVPQDPILFHRSLMENIRYGRLDAKDEEVMAAAQLAHCHEFISRFPKGYETKVGERGVKLSGGERQRIAIARAILANTKILILDEATSSLDSESEKLIQDALAHLIKNKTTFVIAHRLSTIVKMDRILVLEEGKIIEEGSHSVLIRKEGGLYRKLWELQGGGYLA